jgi:hypothetical protein
MNLIKVGVAAMIRLADFFRNPLYERALSKYAEVAKSRNWQIRNKLQMYQWAKQAFDSDLSDDRKRAVFNNIYNNFRSYWQVFRKARGRFVRPRVGPPQVIDFIM